MSMEQPRKPIKHPTNKAYSSAQLPINYWIVWMQEAKTIKVNFTAIGNVLKSWK